MSAEGSVTAAKISRFRFSLRSLLLAVAACAILLGLFGDKARVYQRDASIARELTARGAYVAWRGLRVEYVSLRGSRDADHCIALMSQLSSHESLDRCNLAGSDVTDEGVHALLAMPRLRRLGLSDTNISDAGVLHLVKAKGLRELDLFNTHVSRQAVRRLRRELPHAKIDRGAYEDEIEQIERGLRELREANKAKARAKSTRLGHDD